MSLSLVDGKGNQVPLLQCSPPSSHAYEEIDTETDLESCITTQVFELNPDSKKPGKLSVRLCTDQSKKIKALDKTNSQVFL